MPPRRSPLHDLQERHGASFVAWQGALWAQTFGDPEAEHLAVRSGVGVWDVSALRTWEVRGRDALRLLDRAFTNDVAGSDPGQIRYGLLCDEAGTIVNDATVYRLEGDRAWMLTSREEDGEHVERRADGLDAAVAPRIESPAVLQVQGPRSWELLAALAPDAPPLRFLRFHPDPVHVGDTACVLSRIGFSGELGFELFCAPDRAEALWRLLTGAGARPYGFGAVQTLRVEAGLLLLGEDLVPGQTTPYDVSLDAVVCLDKPELVGRAALAAVRAAPPRRLATLVVDGDEVPARGAPVTVTGAVVGAVTSAVRSPTLGAVLALATVAAGHEVPGVAARVGLADGGDAPARVTTTPAYDPAKRRSRVALTR
jgi:aminomethyltransferase